MIKGVLRLIKSFIVFNLKIIYVLVILVLVTTCAVSSYFSIEETPARNFENVVFTMQDVSDDKFDDSLLLGNNSKSFFQVLYTLETIKNNSKVKRIIINLDKVNATATQVEELIEEFNSLKDSGKDIVAFGSELDNTNYPLASIANEIVMPDTMNARLTLHGYLSSNLYYKNILTKYGVRVYGIHQGNFKSYGENYYLDEMSPELKSEKKYILETRLQNLILTVSANRDISFDEVDNNIANGNYYEINPYEAKKYKLIDEVEDLDDYKSDNMINSRNTINFDELIANSPTATGNVIAYIPLEGDITGEPDGLSLYISNKEVNEKLNQAKKIVGLKAVVLRINSPGGSAFEANKIYKSIMKFKEKMNVPVYVSMSSVAASGGYYIAVAADKIYADNATITGSIGVVSLIPKFDKTLDKFGVTNDILSKGKYVGMYDPYTELNKDDIARINKVQHEIYVEFKKKVEANRGIKDDELEPIAGGRVWLGEEAGSLGLVDGIGGLLDTFNSLGIDNYSIQEITSKRDVNSYMDKLGKYVGAYVDVKALKNIKFILNNAKTPLYYSDSMQKVDW